jgi:hypothetical protein
MHLLRVFTRVCIPSLLVGSVSLRAAVASADSHVDAGTHFEAGVHAFEEQRFSDAAREFEQAYQLEPTWQVLFNLGSVYAALGRPVEAVDAFERYESDGGARVSDERRQTVDAELARQRAKIAFLDIRVNEPNAEIRIDLRLVGRSPYPGPVKLGEGTHVVEVALDGRKPQRRELRLVGGQHLSAAFTLVSVVPPPPAKTPVSAAPPVPSSSSVGTAQRVVGYVMGGVGLVGVGGGIVILAQGQSLHVDAVDTANAGDRAEAERMESEAEHKKTLGFATIGVGGTLVLGGLVLLLTAPTSSRHVSFGISPWATTSAQGITWKGTW